MSIATSPWDYNAYESESLTKDEQMFIYKDIYCERKNHNGNPMKLICTKENCKK